MPKKLPLAKVIVIVGPTASGKTGLGIMLAKKLGGEVVSADSRLIYKGMDIGTAKPTKKEKAGIPHHLIDLVPPSKTLTAAEWKKKAIRSIDGILKRGNVPIVVGGTGLYVRALVENLSIPEVAPDHALRRKLDAMPRPELFAWLHKLDPAYAERAGNNHRYAIRALEVMQKTGKTMTELQTSGKPLYRFLITGLKPSKTALKKRIEARTAAMKRAGLEKEVSVLSKKYGWDAPAMSGIGYRELKEVFEGKKTLQEALSDVSLHTRQYAKRQMTWFKRDRKTRWITQPIKGLRLAEKFIKAG